VDGNTRDERRRSIAALSRGELDVITNCGLISEGVDVPAIGAAILLRPTQSLALYLQLVGRALRPAPGKRALILDHAGNVIRHGLPDDARTWSLQGAKPDRADKRAAAFRRCPHCGALNLAGAAHCVECGVVSRAPKAPAVAAPPDLAAASYREALEWAGSSISRLKLVAAARVYKPGWVWARMTELRERRKGAAA
jgi:superfamily II DNA or RNA helicase